MQRLLLGDAFHAVAAARAATGASLDEAAAPKASIAQLEDRAYDSDDEHHVKLTEAAVREYKLTGRPELLAAAESWMATSST